MEKEKERERAGEGVGEIDIFYSPMYTRFYCLLSSLSRRQDYKNETSLIVNVCCTKVLADFDVV